MCRAQTVVHTCGKIVALWLDPCSSRREGTHANEPTYDCPKLTYDTHCMYEWVCEDSCQEENDQIRQHAYTEKDHHGGADKPFTSDTVRKVSIAEREAAEKTCEPVEKMIAALNLSPSSESDREGGPKWLLELAKEWLRWRGRDVVLLSFPGGLQAASDLQAHLQSGDYEIDRRMRSRKQRGRRRQKQSRKVTRKQKRHQTKGQTVQRKGRGQGRKRKHQKQPKEPQRNRLGLWDCLVLNE
jgi:hypothetical protein